jgi:hypothetical protein
MTEQEILMSTSQGFASDLDGRPGEMTRSTMPFWVQTCPNCTYCAPDIATAEAGVQAFLNQSTYQRQRTNPDFPDLANQFLCASMILAHSGKNLHAAWQSIFAAWCCDDDGQEQNALFCRNQALDLISRATRKEWLDQRVQFDSIVRVDLLRRARRFSEALSEIQKFQEIETDLFRHHVFMFEKTLVQNQDSASYSTDAAIGPITKAQDLNEALKYICKFFEKLLTPNEREIAFTQYTTEESGYIWITRNPDHLRILSQGIDIFTEKLVQRLKTDYPKRFILNQCPRCSKATRTPVSKQCRYCGHDWHEA